MKARPAFLFYPSDWLRDPALQCCSLAAQGLWIAMMAHMHEGIPYGHLKVGKKIIDATLLSRMVDSPPVRSRNCSKSLKNLKFFLAPPMGRFTVGAW